MKYHLTFLELSAFLCFCMQKPVTFYTSQRGASNLKISRRYEVTEGIERSKNNLFRHFEFVDFAKNQYFSWVYLREIWHTYGTKNDIKISSIVQCYQCHSQVKMCL